MVILLPVCTPCKQLNAKFNVRVTECPTCDPDACANLCCFGDFEAFDHEDGNSLVEDLTGHYWNVIGSRGNSPDVCDVNGNKVARIHSDQSKFEGLAFALKSPIKPGCQINLELDAASGVNPSDLNIYMSEFAPCEISR